VEQAIPNKELNRETVKLQLEGMSTIDGASPDINSTRRAKRAWARNHLPSIVVSIGIAAVLIGGWQFSGRYLNPITISTPGEILRSIPKTFFHGPYGSLLSALGVTMIDFGLGFLGALVIGTSVGLAIGNSRVARNILDPLVALGNSSPTIALLPLIIIWFGFGHSSRVLFITVVSMWGMAINTAVGARKARERYEDLIPAFSVGPKMYLTSVVLPGSMPFIFAGIRVSLAHSLVATIISGQEIGNSGIGGLAQLYGDQFKTNDLFGVIVVTTIIALVLYRGIEFLRNRVCNWVNYS